jgi:hypothetical protein
MVMSTHVTHDSHSLSPINKFKGCAVGLVEFGPK